MSAQPIPMDAAELNALREQEAREAWALVQATVELNFRCGLITNPSAICGIRRALTTVENELGFGPRNRWNG